MTMICLEYMFKFIDVAYYYYYICKLEIKGEILFVLHIMLLCLKIYMSVLSYSN